MYHYSTPFNKKYEAASNTASKIFFQNNLLDYLSHFWLATVQEVLQAD